MVDTSRSRLQLLGIALGVMGWSNVASVVEASAGPGVEKSDGEAREERGTMEERARHGVLGW